MINISCARVAAASDAGKTRVGRMRLRLVLIAALAIASTNAIAQSSMVASGSFAFHNIVALASAQSRTTDSGQSFMVKCDSGVAGTLRLYSTTQRVMRNNA